MMPERPASLRAVPHRSMEASRGERFASAVATALDFSLTVAVRTLRYAPHTAIGVLAIVLWYMTPHTVLAEVARLRVQEVRAGIVVLGACSAVVGLLSATLTPYRH